MLETRLRVGIIGVGKLAQTIFLPTLQLLNQVYTITSICDLEPQTLALCQTRYKILRTTTSAHDLINDPDLDLIFILTPDEYHEVYCIESLKAGKHVFVETPITFSIQSAQRILDARRDSKGKVFVGYVRRFAPSFLDAFKKEVAGIGRIMHARCCDFTGQGQGEKASFAMGPESPSGDEAARLFQNLLQETFICQDVTPERISFCRLLCSLGWHDLSIMRETFGYPDSVVGVTANDPHYSATFNYHDNEDHSFSVTYESGIDSVPRQDACFTVYGQAKTVSIEYSTPFPVKVIVDEMKEDGELRRRELVSSSTEQDAYIEELTALYSSLVDGVPIKTSVEDAIKDLKLSRMIFEQYDRQCGTVRTPLG